MGTKLIAFQLPLLGVCFAAPVEDRHQGGALISGWDLLGCLGEFSTGGAYLLQVFF
jgi:hypothetical protein